jgi:hypothetical protein
MDGWMDGWMREAGHVIDKGRRAHTCRPTSHSTCTCRNERDPIRHMHTHTHRHAYIHAHMIYMFTYPGPKLCGLAAGRLPPGARAQNNQVIGLVGDVGKGALCVIGGGWGVVIMCVGGACRGEWGLVMVGSINPINPIGTRSMVRPIDPPINNPPSFYPASTSNERGSFAPETGRGASAAAPTRASPSCRSTAAAAGPEWHAIPATPAAARRLMPVVAAAGGPALPRPARAAAAARSAAPS